MKQHEHFWNKQNLCMLCGAHKPQDPRIKQSTRDTMKTEYLKDE